MQEVIKIIIRSKFYFLYLNYLKLKTILKNVERIAQ